MQASICLTAEALSCRVAAYPISVHDHKVATAGKKGTGKRRFVSRMLRVWTMVRFPGPLTFFSAVAGNGTGAPASAAAKRPGSASAGRSGAAAPASSRSSASCSASC